MLGWFIDCSLLVAMRKHPWDFNLQYPMYQIYNYSATYCVIVLVCITGVCVDIIVCLSLSSQFISYCYTEFVLLDIPD